jgi:hypothetical protein
VLLERRQGEAAKENRFVMNKILFIFILPRHEDVLFWHISVRRLDWSIRPERMRQDEIEMSRRNKVAGSSLLIAQ